mgnify:CR=1 FL=1
MIPVPFSSAHAMRNNSANFGLFFNKFTAIDEAKLDVPIDAQRQWVNQYDNYTRSEGAKQLRRHLNTRHLTQSAFCRMWEKKGWRTITLHARLTSPMILGLGETHPSETGMLFDRNLGIPYIPASSIKGVVRFAHTLGLLKGEDGVWLEMDALQDRFDFDKDDKDVLVENDKTIIPQIFGQAEKNKARRGALIVLDAYPLDIPRLKVDIMNPHYPDYYKGERGPTEDQNPIPLKFLVVDQGAEFVFRALVKPNDNSAPDADDLAGKCRKAYLQALTVEGLGAKTALGYGRFATPVEGEPARMLELFKQIEAEKEKACLAEEQRREQERLEQMSPDERLIIKIKGLGKDSQSIADLVKECLDSPAANREVFSALKARLQELGEWKPDGSKQKKEKMRARNEAIEKKIQ